MIYKPLQPLIQPWRQVHAWYHKTQCGAHAWQHAKVSARWLYLQTQFLATYESEEGGWRGGLQPYGPMSLLPSSQALNYGQSIFEGMKVNIRNPCPVSDDFKDSGVSFIHHNTAPSRSRSSISVCGCAWQAQRSAKGRIVLFRPNKNAERMQSGAARMLMPAPPVELFIRAVRKVVEANQVGKCAALCSFECTCLGSR